VHEEDSAFERGRLGEITERVEQAVGIRLVHVLRVDAHRAKTDLVVVAARADREGVALPDHAAAEIAHEMVPHHLQAVVRDRERSRGTIELLEAETLEPGLAGMLADLVRNFFRQRSRAPRRVDVHAELGELPQHRRLPGREFRLVLRDVVARDGEERLVLRERVDVSLLRRPAGGCLRESAFPGRNAAIRIAGSFRTDRRQVLAEAGVVLVARKRGAREGKRAEQRGKNAVLHGARSYQSSLSCRATFL